jgi:hypothetical protein
MAELKKKEIAEKENIIEEIKAYIIECGGSYPDWYVGVTGDSDQRLFVEHNVKKKGGAWILFKASSSTIAREVEKYFIDQKTKGGTGGGNDDSDIVYAYKTRPYTKEQ